MGWTSAAPHMRHIQRHTDITVYLVSLFMFHDKPLVCILIKNKFIQFLYWLFPFPTTCISLKLVNFTSCATMTFSIGTVFHRLTSGEITHDTFCCKISYLMLNEIHNFDL
jgi:hypothetical protein